MSEGLLYTLSNTRLPHYPTRLLNYGDETGRMGKDWMLVDLGISVHTTRRDPLSINL